MQLAHRDHEERPWGSFDRFTLNEQTTVKIISANPGHSLSLQYHRKRDEFWHILSGQGEVVIGEEKHPAKAGDEFFIPAETKHRMATKESSVDWLGSAFGEVAEAGI